MSLPSGYKLLKYIQSSGTQYINTGFKPKGTTKIVCDFQMVNQGTEQQGVFGSKPGASGRFTVFTGDSTGALQVDYDTYGALAEETSTISGLNLNNRNTIEVNNSLIINENTVKTVSAVSFTSTYNLFLFANNNAGTAQLPGILKLYSCQIYDNGTLVRDFIPCKNTGGAVGLWDDVNSVLYVNAGTGTFTAGPEALEIPPTPTGFVASFLAETTVQLSWSVSENAAGYKLYKNGVLLSTLTDTSYTDTVQVFSGTLYAVTAYNDDGESTAAELTYCSIPENPILYLVTDRTEPDVAYAKELSEKGLDGMSDAEKAEWLSGLKGAYTAADLNRVESAVDYVAGRLQSFGNAVEVYPKKGWTTNDVPTVSPMNRYLNDVAALRAVLAVLPTTPEVPPDMDGLTYTEANNIEQILKDIDLLITNMTAAWFYSGDLYAGEV